MRRLLQALATCLLLACSPAIAQQPESEHARTVKNFVAAFNSQDSAAMAKFVADDVQWLSIDGEKLSVDTSGKAALVTAMDSYFKSCPTCKSQLTSVIASRDRVSAIEAASWEGKSGPRTQSGVSVYEFSGELIRRVYYFAVED